MFSLINVNICAVASLVINNHANALYTNCLRGFNATVQRLIFLLYAKNGGENYIRFANSRQPQHIENIKKNICIVSRASALPYTTCRA